MLSNTPDAIWQPCLGLGDPECAVGEHLVYLVLGELGHQGPHVLVALQQVETAHVRHVHTLVHAGTMGRRNVNW